MAERPSLAVTVHDPDERWLGLFEPALGELATLYSGRTAACTGATSVRTLAALEAADFVVIQTGVGSAAGENRRTAVAKALALSKERVHYADLDRLLHWQRSFPSELRALLAAPPDADYVALGRTQRAWRTHPRVQVLAERLTNAALVDALGLDRAADFTAGSCLLSRRAAEVVVRLSIERGYGTDLEWPALVSRELGTPPACVATEGLEFETADRFADEIARLGSRAAWIRAYYGRTAVWLERAEIAHQSIAAVGRVLGGGPPER